MTIDAYPLQWPNGKPRSVPKRSKFQTRHTAAVALLQGEVRRLGGTNLVISTNIPLRRDGLPYASREAPKDCGVAVFLSYKKRAMCFACDKWDSVEDNIHAIGKTIEALRGIERWGTGHMVEQAFSGFVALPVDSPWSTLGLREGASVDEIERNYRIKAKEFHPDRGGSHEQMSRINAAPEELLRRSATK